MGISFSNLVVIVVILKDILLRSVTVMVTVGMNKQQYSVTVKTTWVRRQSPEEGRRANS
jgi:hypothetical protein